MTRSEAINYLTSTGLTEEQVMEVVEALRQEPKMGHWEWVQYDSNPNIGNWHCSECNRIVCGAITAANPVYAYKYCPDCGAKMFEPQESEDKE
ncbi:MAG: hypothetical protein II444_05555 [Firmicutes bacterium]|nr:hypothetical protein [Bacillota bacterium]MBQ5769285.1 hypothetical protein [Clostridiales bacterium]